LWGAALLVPPEPEPQLKYPPRKTMADLPSGNAAQATIAQFPRLRQHLQHIHTAACP
jgi:hypothetical protein